MARGRKRTSKKMRRKDGQRKKKIRKTKQATARREARKLGKRR